MYLTRILIFLCLSKLTLTFQAVELRFQRPVTTYMNDLYTNYINVTARRFGRHNPIYYVDINYNSKVWYGDNFTLHFYIYEFLSNEYRRSFFEMHVKFCEMAKSHPIFKYVVGSHFPKPCPYPPGNYHLHNLTLAPSTIPKVKFPFTKGRAFVNITEGYHDGIPKYLCGSLHIDMEVLTINKKRKGN